MKRLSFLLLLTLGCTTSEPERPGTPWATEERVEPQPTVEAEPSEPADPNGENYREVWGREHRQRYISENGRTYAVPPGVGEYGGMKLTINWPRTSPEFPAAPAWMQPLPDQERWLTIALLSSSDPRPRRFDATWYDGSYPMQYVGPWSSDSKLNANGTPIVLKIQDRNTESRLPDFIRDVSDLDEIYVKLEVPSTGHYFERICRREDNYTQSGQYGHLIYCQLVPEDLSSWD